MQVWAAVSQGLMPVICRRVQLWFTQNLRRSLMNEQREWVDVEKEQNNGETIDDKNVATD